MKVSPEIVRALMLIKGINVDDLARRMKVSAAFVDFIINGKRSADARRFEIERHLGKAIWHEVEEFEARRREFEFFGRDIRALGVRPLRRLAQRKGVPVQKIRSREAGIAVFQNFLTTTAGADPGGGGDDPQPITHDRHNTSL